MGNRKITVIGAGSVGSTTAFALALKNLANEIILIDIRDDKALGEAQDIHQGTPLMDEPVNVHAGNYETAAGSDYVIITSGMPRKPGQSRLDLAQTNVDIIREIAPQIVKTCPDATYIIISNPVDVLTYVFLKVTGLPENRVLGSGTLLDTARLRARIAEYLAVSQRNVHAYVFGEHGDSSFIPWSIAEISTLNISDYKDSLKLFGSMAIDLDYEEIEDYMRSSGATIIKRKGCTNYAIAVSVCGIIECLSGGVNAVATVSTMMNGEYGVSDVCLSLPVLLGNGKIQGRILPKLTEEEISKFHASAEALKSVISNINYTSDSRREEQ